MTMSKNMPGPDVESEHYPLEPRYHPVNRVVRAIYDFLASSKLAMALLVVILACCVTGVTVFRGERAWVLIFSTLWFNAILVLLVINIACCFFGRIWGRRVTLVSIGMILFHLSFVAMLGGVVYNSLFSFRGLIRLTEGETLPSGDPRSYDTIEQGPYFDILKLKGETTLIKMYREYRIGADEKSVAYEIAVGDGILKKQGIIYITNSLENRGFSYFRDKEGYSILVVLYDKQGQELYGGFLALQGLKQKDDSYLYTTGTKVAPGALSFPHDPVKPLFSLQVAYIPTPIKERAGEAYFQVWPLHQGDAKQDEEPVAEGKATIGEKFKVGDHYLAVTEVRYWVGMMVRYDPGKPIVLTSLWVGLGGMIITFIGRIRKSGN